MCKEVDTACCGLSLLYTRNEQRRTLGHHPLFVSARLCAGRDTMASQAEAGRVMLRAARTTGTFLRPFYSTVRYCAGVRPSKHQATNELVGSCCRPELELSNEEFNSLITSVDGHLISTLLAEGHSCLSQ